MAPKLWFLCCLPGTWLIVHAALDYSLFPTLESCAYLFMCQVLYYILYVFSLNLSKTYCKVALDNLVLQKRKRNECVSQTAFHCILVTHDFRTSEASRKVCVLLTPHTLERITGVVLILVLGNLDEGTFSSRASMNVVMVGKERGFPTAS